ncbi:Putative uncharacterized transposon-derived protein F52C9.6, partial [Toxocara canis]
MTYGSETWSVIKSEKERLAVAERAMERRMLRISLRDHITNDKIRNETKVADVNEECWRNKLRWAGHVARIRDNRWTKKIYQWYPRDIKRPPGRHPMRWADEIREVEGPLWQRLAANRERWKRKVGRLHLSRQYVADSGIK